MEEIIIGSPEELQMPPEPPQKRAEEVGAVHQPKKPNAPVKRGFNQPELKQPEKPKVVEEAKVEEVSLEVAQAAATKPNIERAPVTQKGKIARKASRGRARPL